MKNIMISALLSCMTSLAYAEPQIAADQRIDRYSQLCLEVLKSEKALVQTARKLGVTKNERNRLICNEMSVDQFANNYRITDESTIATVQ